MFAIDNERAAQLFAGDTIEVEFTPATNYNPRTSIIHRFGTDKDSTIYVPVGFYGQNITITNLTKNIVLFNANTNFETTPCNSEAATT
jgi:hypothetical protein